MIGLFGIVAHEGVIEKGKRLAAFSRMKDDIGPDEDLRAEILNGHHFSVGIIKRILGENKDLAVKAFGDHFLCAFCGYGKFRGEKRLYWADTMVDRAAEIFQDKGVEALNLIEGSFQVFIIQGTAFLTLSDRFSSKNFFYYRDDKFFVFAPDVGRIVQSGLIPKIKDIDASKQVLTSGFFLDDSTLVKGVRRCPYGTRLEGRISHKLEIEARRYWEVPENEGTVDEVKPSLVNEFEGKIKQAIDELSALETRTVVPLSGGLDSRAIAYYVSKKQLLVAVTYDLGDEVHISRKVCKSLNGSQSYFSNNIIQKEGFKNALKRMVEQQRIHAVVNQYFYAPLFRNYFNENKNVAALFDGVYMDILFSAPYTRSSFDAGDFVRTYCRGAAITGSFCSRNFKEIDFLQPAKEVYLRIERELKRANGVGKSQKAYLNGRLRRYVLEFLSFKEDYSYVFKPGFDYELVDFGYSLSLRLRKGLLYRELFKTFPEIKNIPYKDSYGNRSKTLMDKAKENYRNLRLKISYGTNGLFPYFPYQVEWFFLGLKQIDNYKSMLLESNCIAELFDDEDLERLFEAVKRKHYLSNLFQRVLFLQQFYRRYKF